GDDHLQAAARGTAGVVEHPVGGAGCGDHRHLVRDAELGQRLRGGAHHRPVRIAAHDYTDRTHTVSRPWPCTGYPSGHAPVARKAAEAVATSRTGAGSSPDTVMCPILRPGRSGFAYRCTFACG